MGKTVFANEDLLNILNKHGGTEGFTPGFIVGQCTAKKDFAIHLAVTSKLEEENSKNVEHYKEFNQIDESLLKAHLKNVTRSLPGGIYVLGLFIIGPTDIFTDKQALQKVRTIVSNLHNCTKTNPYLFGSSFKSGVTVLHFSSTSRKYQSKNIDVQSMSLAMTPVNWKFVKQPVSWFKIDCNFWMETLIPYYTTEKNHPIKKLIKDLLAYFEKELDSCTCTLSGYFEKNNDYATLKDIQGKLIKKMGFEKKLKDNEIEEYEQLNVLKAMFFKKTKPAEDDTEQLFEFCVTDLVKFKGDLSSKTYLHKDATIEEAVIAIKEDLLRTWASRLELHCDSLEENTRKKITHVPPKRILVDDEGSGIMFTEYMFQDDTKEDIVNSLEENLGIHVTPDSIVELEEWEDDIQDESIQDEEAVSINHQKGNNDQLHLKIKNLSNNLFIIGLVCAALVLFISIAAHFLL